MKATDLKLNLSASYSQDKYQTPPKSINPDKEKFLSESKKLAFSI